MRNFAETGQADIFRNIEDNVQPAKLEDLDTDSGGPELKALSGNPDIIIRMDVGLVDPGLNAGERHKLIYNKELEQIIAEVKKSREIFKELEECGINIPKFQTVIGKDENGNVRTYTVTEKVQGRKIDFYSGDKEFIKSIAEQWAELEVNFAKYLFDKWQNKEDYWCDGLTVQCMYGKTKSDTDEKIYMIDIGDNPIVKVEKFGPMGLSFLELHLKSKIKHLEQLGSWCFEDKNKFSKSIEALEEISQKVISSKEK